MCIISQPNQAIHSNLPLCLHYISTIFAVTQPHTPQVWLTQPIPTKKITQPAVLGVTQPLMVIKFLEVCGNSLPFLCVTLLVYLIPEDNILLMFDLKVNKFTKQYKLEQKYKV